MIADAFRTPDGRRVPAVSADEMREVDRVAVDEAGLALPVMMENAGRSLARAVRERHPVRVAVLAGDGGNGGGGLACARHLANRGVAVRVTLDRPRAALSGAAATQARILEAADVPVNTDPPAEADLVVDALVGYGLVGPLDGPAADLAAAADAMDAPVISLDVPSGVNATTGERPGPAVDPATVLTLALPKAGLVEGSTPVRLADIGIPGGVFERADLPYESPFDAWLVDLERSPA
ncbi:MAG: NAD(P)H-hydrate epimerase [Haloglomus sp.]